MLRRPLRLLAALSLFVAAATTGCDVTHLPSFPDQARQESPGEALRLVTRRDAGTAGGEDLTVVQVIGTDGGRIDAAGHTLIVPSGAVDSDTEFTFTVVAGSHVQVGLGAGRVSDGAVVSQFPTNLTLTLSYGAVDVDDPSRLANAYLVDGTADGSLQALPSSVDTTTQTVSSSLSHFSGYAMAIN